MSISSLPLYTISWHVFVLELRNCYMNYPAVRIIETTVSQLWGQGRIIKLRVEGGGDHTKTVFLKPYQVLFWPEGRQLDIRW